MEEALKKTVSYIFNKTPIWCYTLNYKTRKIKERCGRIVFFNSYETRASFLDEDDKRSWATWTLNGLSPYEATVRGATVWFSKPSYEEAIAAFREAGMKMADEYDKKSIKSYYRSSRLEVANGN